MTGELLRSACGSQGVNAAGVLDFVDAVEAAGLELHGFMVLRHGFVVAEGWWHPYGPNRPHMLYSLSKSFTSTAVGFAVTEGLLTVDDPVLSFFPEYQGKRSGFWERLRVRHLLTMTTGHEKAAIADTQRADGDWVASFFGDALTREPGSYFLYNSGASYMLSVIVQRLTGLRVIDYLTPRLLEPLGIEGAVWERCPRGYDAGGWGLSVRTEDIARFGQFLLQRGCWRGKQLLPARWVDEAAAPQVSNGDPAAPSDWSQGYGYQFWCCVPEGVFRGDGAFGQYCIVLPGEDAVIAIQSGVMDMQGVLSRAWEHLIPAMGGAGSREDDRRLARRMACLSYEPPVEQAQGIRLEHRCLLRLDDNAYGIGQIALEPAGDRLLMVLEAEGWRAPLACGSGRWAESRGAVPFSSLSLPVPVIATLASSACFAWTDAHTLEVRIRLVETPYTLTIAFGFGSQRVRVEAVQRAGEGEIERFAVEADRIGED